MTTVAVIPARGGSKGIPRKNLLPLMGKPLVAWTIEQALAAELVDEVIVSSDCESILAVAHEYGARPLRRPKEFATDTATSESVVKHAIGNTYADDVVLLQCTSPIRQPWDIDNAIRLHRANIGWNGSVFSARHVEGFVWVDDLKPAGHGSMRQERKPQVEENGSIYVLRAPDIRKGYARCAGAANMHYLMHPLDSFQIDEPTDVELIESLWPLRMAHTMEAVCT